MMHRRWLLAITLVIGTGFLGACNHGGESDDGGTPDGGGKDMKVGGGTCDAGAAKVDAAVAPTGQVIPPKGVGTACKADADCTEGPKPVCFKQTLFDQTALLPVVGGYCSSTCTQDSDCGSNNLCFDFGTQGKACILGCGDAVTCRHPGYSCAIVGADATGALLTGCVPWDNLDCNPEDKNPCKEVVNGQPGACLRQAIEDDHGGFCLPLCKVGDACGTDKFTEQLSCLQIDFTPGGDAFRGTLCFPQAATPLNPGATCQFSNDCVDGYECDNGPGGSHKCAQLCTLNKVKSTCPAGTTCQDAFAVCTGAGLCK